MHADFLGPYRSNVVVNAFESIAEKGPGAAELAEKYPGTSQLEGYVVDRNARLTACLATALEQLGCLGREVEELRQRVAAIEGDGRAGTS